MKKVLIFGLLAILLIILSSCVSEFKKDQDTQKQNLEYGKIILKVGLPQTKAIPENTDGFFVKVFNENNQVNKFVDISLGETKEIIINIPVGTYTVDTFGYEYKFEEIATHYDKILNSSTRATDIIVKTDDFTSISLVMIPIEYDLSKISKQLTSSEKYKFHFGISGHENIKDYFKSWLYFYYEVGENNNYSYNYDPVTSHINSLYDATDISYDYYVETEITLPDTEESTLFTYHLQNVVNINAVGPNENYESIAGFVLPMNSYATATINPPEGGIIISIE